VDPQDEAVVVIMNLRAGLERRWKSACWKAQNHLHALLLTRVNLEWKLASGIVLRVKSPADWGIYNDIFVENEYDLPLRETMSRATGGGPVRILDLGANVGFFALRALHLRHLLKVTAPLELCCVEGSPRNFQELRSRVGALAGQLRLVHGLAGERSGNGAIQQSASHGMTRVVAAASRKAPRVDYVDLMELTRGWETIDLLKCDIEGSEEAVLKNYPDLLRKTRGLVMELHHHLVDVANCRRLAQAAGLTRHRVLAKRPFCSVEYFTPDAPDSDL
jgi:FkbM family methyltransferase